jgi:acetone carboxylase gamma subunit
MNQGFASVGYALRDQTCEIEKAIGSSTSQILAGQKDAEMRELNREIAALREEKQDYKFSSMLGAYIGPLKQEVAEIKCHLPKTVVIPANDDYVRVDRSISEPYARCGCGFGFGGYGANYGIPFPNGGGFFG